MTTHKRNWPELLMGLGIILAGLIIGWEAASIKVGPLYAKVGPSAFLWVAFVLLTFCGALVAWKGWRTPITRGDEMAGPLCIMAGLGWSPFLMEPLGFIPTAIVVFMCTALGLGSRNHVRDFVVAVSLATTAYFIFAKGLGLRLPQGIIPL